MIYGHADHARTLHLFDESFELFRQIDDVGGQATALIGAGIIEVQRGNRAKGRSLLQRSLELARAR